MSDLLDWINNHQPLLQLAGPLATTIASITAGIIAWRFGEAQRRIAHNKIALDLFDKRFALIQKIAEVMALGVRSTMDDRVQGRNLISQTRYLFGADVWRHLKSAFNDLSIVSLEYDLKEGRDGWSEAATAAQIRLLGFTDNVWPLLKPYMSAGIIRLDGSTDDP